MTVWKATEVPLHHSWRRGFTPSSPDRGAPDSDGYSTVSETAGCWCRCRGCRGSRERKWLAPTRLDMPIFKSTDPGAEVMYMLWHFDVDAFLKQYDEASMCPHIFASLHGYPGKWAHMLDKGKDISMRDLLMHMEKMFANKHDYDAMIRTLYEVQQRDKSVEEFMLHIHEAVTVICHAYPERLPDRGRDLKKDRFYHGLHPYLHDALSFAMAELPEREQAHPTFDTLYTLAKKVRSWATCTYVPVYSQLRDIWGKAQALPSTGGPSGSLGRGGVGIDQSCCWGGFRVRSRSGRWPQCAPGTGDEPLPERGVTVFRVWVTWPFCQRLPPPQGI